VELAVVADRRRNHQLQLWWQQRLDLGMSPLLLHSAHRQE
jgi:hypothetical protein